MQTLAVIYGLFEGPRTGRAFVAECRRRGYDVIDDASEASVIVAHSGGWMFLPTDIAGKQVVLIDAANKSRRSFASKFFGRMAYDLRYIVFSRLLFVWLIHRVLNIWYFIIRFPLWLEMARRYNTRDILPLVIKPNVTVIQSNDLSWFDDGTMSQADDLIRLSKGCHDNCWIHPPVYLNKLTPQTERNI